MSYTITGHTPVITTIHSLFCRTFQADYRFRGESHDFYELVCVLEGQVYITAGNRVFELTAGQAMLHPPMQFHNIGSAGGSSPTVLVISFSGEHIPPLQDKVCRIGNLSRARELYELGQRTFTMDIDMNLWVTGTIDSGESHRPLRFAGELGLFLLRLADHSHRSHTVNGGGAATYSAIVQVMEENIHRRLTVSQLAQRCHLSDITLHKTFARYAGVGVMAYYTRLKMQTATRLLEQGATVKATALAVGYHDQNYFSTVFKRVTGHNPSSYRK